MMLGDVPSRVGARTMHPVGSDTADFSNVTELFPTQGKARSVDFDEAFYGRDRNVWLNRVRRKLADLTVLQENWDTYGANPVAPDTVLFGFQVLSEIWLDGLSDPDISPMSNEGIMFEWIRENCEFIIELEGPYKIRYFFNPTIYG